MTTDSVYTISVLLKSGGNVILRNAFIAGNGVAGDVDAKTIRIADADIASIKQLTP